MRCAAADQGDPFSIGDPQPSRGFIESNAKGASFIDVVMAGARDRPVEDQAGHDPGQCPRPLRANEPIFSRRDDRHRDRSGPKILRRFHLMAEEPSHRKPGIMIAGDVGERIERRDEDEAVDRTARSEVGGHAASDAEADGKGSTLA